MRSESALRHSTIHDYLVFRTKRVIAKRLMISGQIIYVSFRYCKIFLVSEQCHILFLRYRRFREKTLIRSHF